MKNKIASYFVCILSALFISACIISTTLAVKKYAAIAYDFDYGYYLQIATKLFDQKSSHVVTMAPIGANMFGLGAFEGVKGYHKTIHFEIAKYFPAVVYFISGRVWVIFLAVTIGYFSPLIYMLLIFKDRDADEKLDALIYGFLYTLSPTVLATATYDLRVPFIYMVPSILSLFLSIYYKRSFWEICFFFNLLFIIREEALVYLAILIVYYYFRNHVLGSESPKYVVGLVVNWLIWAGIIYFFMRWSGYGLTDKNIVRLDLLSSVLYRYWAYLLILFSALSIVGFKLYKYLRPRKDGLFIRIFNDVFLVASLSAPILFWVGKKMSSSMNLSNIVYFPRFTLILPMIIIIGLILGKSYIKFEVNKQKYLLAAATFTAFMFVLNFLPISDAAAMSWIQVDKKIVDARLVWEVKTIMDKYETVVLADQPTVEAFYDFDKINIFPCSAPNYFNLVQRDEPQRCYPGNKEYLVNLIKNKVEYIVVTKGSLPLVSDLMLQAHVKSLESKTNDTYAWIRLSKK